MNERAIRRPKGPTVIFLIESLAIIFSILSTLFMAQLLEYPEEMSPINIIQILILGVTNLFMSIVLFSKKYNNLLLIGAGLLLIPNIFGLFINISPYTIGEIIFYLLFIAFTYIMVKMPETHIREKAVKFRFIIPIFQFVLILISTIQTMQGLYENFTETMGSQLSDPLSLAIILVPSILGALTGFLPVLCYALLSNWLADPYEK